MTAKHRRRKHRWIYIAAGLLIGSTAGAFMPTPSVGNGHHHVAHKERALSLPQPHLRKDLRMC